MSILIKGMEMPKSCSDCPMLDWDLDHIKCKVTGRHFNVKEEAFGARRVDDCPLISVPPHGDLIDRDAVEYEEAYLNGHYELGDVEIVTREDIESAPTIIPAEEGEG